MQVNNQLHIYSDIAEYSAPISLDGLNGASFQITAVMIGSNLEAVIQYSYDGENFKDSSDTTSFATVGTSVVTSSTIVDAPFARLRYGPSEELSVSGNYILSAIGTTYDQG